MAANVLIFTWDSPGTKNYIRSYFQGFGVRAERRERGPDAKGPGSARTQRHRCKTGLVIQRKLKA